MSDIILIRQAAVEDATKAVEFEENENFEEAYKFYIKAAEKHLCISKVDENQFNKETYRKKAMEYCERARILKQALTTMSEPQAITTE